MQGPTVFRGLFVPELSHGGMWGGNSQTHQTNTIHAIYNIIYK